MYFESVHALLAMDGHGVYVWSAYLVTVGVIAWTLLAPRYRRKRLLQQLTAELKRAQGSHDVSTREPY